MRHLFIINPAAKRVKGHIDAIKNEIAGFFEQHPEISHDIYISAWCRDAVSYIRGYVAQTRACRDETVRVHAVGGTGTLFEVVNGVIGLPDVQIAAHPYGSVNAFNRYFGRDNLKYFESLKCQVFDDVIPVDVIRGANNYGLCFAIVGLEALSDYRGDSLIEKGLPPELSYLGASIPLIMDKKNLGRRFRVEIDGKRCDGDYISIFIANIPCYGKNMYPGVDAHPDDGKLEIYLLGNDSRFKVFTQTPAYMRGNYKKIKTIFHYSGKTVKISADKSVCMNIDSETFFNTSAEFELLPGAVKFVCPEKIDLGKLPLIYNKPKEGTRSGL